jgi:hypothetical protein
MTLDIERGLCRRIGSRKGRQASRQRARILLWAKIAGIGTIMAIVISLAQIWLWAARRQHGRSPRALSERVEKA